MGEGENRREEGVSRSEGGIKRFTVGTVDRVDRAFPVSQTPRCLPYSVAGEAGVSGGFQGRNQGLPRVVPLPTPRDCVMGLSMANPPERPPTLVPEVLPPEASGSAVRPSARDTTRDGAPAGDRRAPFHAVAALVLIGVDNLWNLEEFAAPPLMVVTIPLSFLSVLFATAWIQRRLHGDRPRVAWWKALFLAVIAAVPFSVTGTPVGLALLAWAGIRHPWRR